MSVVGIALRMFVLLSLAASCKSSPNARSEDARVGGDTTPASDSGTVSDSSTPDTATDAGSPGDATPLSPRAVAVAIHRPASSGNVVAIMALDSNGALVDPGERFGGIAHPRGVVMRRDGREALVAWGSVGGVHGITTYRFDEGGANVVAGTPLELGTGSEPVSVTYVTDTLALVALVDDSDGAPPNEVVALVRETADEPFEVGVKTAFVNDWPLSAAADDGGAAYVLRGKAGSEPSAEIIPVKHSAASGWTSAGTPGLVTPPSRRIVSAGSRVYSPSADPADPVTATDLVGAGKLFVFSRTAAGMQTEPTFDLPAHGTELAVDPMGRFLVIGAIHYEPNADQQPRARGLRWMTVELGASGLPSTVALADTVQSALLMRSLALTSDGTLVTTIEVYQDQAGSPLEVYPLTAWRRKGKEWVATGAPIYLDGQAMVAVAP